MSLGCDLGNTAMWPVDHGLNRAAQAGRLGYSDERPEHRPPQRRPAPPRSPQRCRERPAIQPLAQSPDRQRRHQQAARRILMPLRHDVAFCEWTRSWQGRRDVGGVVPGAYSMPGPALGPASPPDQRSTAAVLPSPAQLALASGQRGRPWHATDGGRHRTAQACRTWSPAGVVEGISGGGSKLHR